MSTAPQIEAHDTSLADHILEIAQRVASELKVDASLLVGIAAVAFMTPFWASIWRLVKSSEEISGSKTCNGLRKWL